MLEIKTKGLDSSELPTKTNYQTIQQKFECLSLLFITTHNKSTYLSSVSKNSPKMTCGQLVCALQQAARIEVIMWEN